ncbi:MAG: hypothetical protein DSO02_05575, partial [Hadesarchaea archaeon]
GNQILLEGKETKVFLDFGRNFAREQRYFADPFLSPRKPEQLFELGLLPEIPGLYTWDENPEISGIFLSHAHLDHMDYVRFIKEEIPIYAGEGTWRIILAREITTPRWASYKLATFEKKPGPLWCCFREERTVKPEQIFRTGRKVKVGEFEISPVHVDHSVPATYGFVIDGPEGRIAYTADLRFHGYRGEMSDDFLKAAEGSDLLITEGTNVLESRPSSEEEVEKKAEGIVRKAKGLVTASFSAVDVDRIRTFFQVAQRTGRKLVISMRQAALLEFIRPEVESGIIDIPFKLGDPEVRIFSRGKEKPYKWEQKLADHFGMVDSQWVSEHQREVLLFATYYDMLELLAAKPEPGSIFIYSESEPWDEEGEMEFEKLANWLEFLGMPMFHIHASGHASSLELAEMVEGLSPKKVIIVHCERPMLFKKFLKTRAEVICPERGKAIHL